MSGEHDDKLQGEQADAGADNAQQTGPDSEQNADVSQEQDSRIQEAVAAALSEQRENVLRAQAEVQNMRRRCESDVEKAHKFALEKFSSELLSVADNLERALSAAPEQKDEQMQSFCEGVDLTLKGFLEVMGRFNVVQVNPLSEPFDPQLHNAVATVPNPEVEPNTVIDVMQKGYTLNGRVIRPAMVAVSKSE